MRTRRLLSIGGVALVALLAGCSPPAEPAIDAAAHRAEIERYRFERIERLRGEYDWLSLVGLFWLEQGDNPFGSDPGGVVVLPEGAAPARAGRVAYDGTRVTVHAAAGVDLTLDGEPADGHVFADTEDGDYGPLQLGRLRLHVIRREGRVGIRVRDPESPTRTGFTGIDAYPVDPAWRIEARFEPFETPRRYPFPNAQGWVSEVEIPGELVFDLQGEEVRLLPQTAGDELFLIFKDATSADTTYAAGRYLYAPFDGEIAVVDFNKAYNPPCAFTGFATCAYPPPQNRLAARIEAGEKRYETE